jgi:PIN domain nuclease of toxin-antitoxin system
MAADPAHLSTEINAIVSNSGNALCLSTASACEIAMLQRLERITLPDAPQRFIPEAHKQLGITPLPLGFATAIEAVMLPFHHRDPFDRIIIAEAIREKMTVLTKDTVFNQYDVQILW